MAPPRSPQGSAQEEGSAGAGDATEARGTAQATAPAPGQGTGRHLLSRSERAALRRKLREKFH